MRIVDPEPWLRRQRDERLEVLRKDLEAGADAKVVRKAMRQARRDYWVALGRLRFLPSSRN